MAVRRRTGQDEKELVCCWCCCWCCRPATCAAPAPPALATVRRDARRSLAVPPPAFCFPPASYPSRPCSSPARARGDRQLAGRPTHPVRSPSLPARHLRLPRSTASQLLLATEHGQPASLPVDLVGPRATSGREKQSLERQRVLGRSTRSAERPWMRRRHRQARRA